MLSIVGPLVSVSGFNDLTSVSSAKTLRGASRIVQADARKLRRQFQDEMMQWRWLVLARDNKVVRTMTIAPSANEQGWRWEYVDTPDSSHPSD